MRRTKVTFFISSMEQGGAERQLAELLTQLDPERFDPSLITCIARDHLGYAMAAKSTYCLDAPHFPTPVSFKQLVEVLRSIAPDIVHTYMGWQNIVGRAAARRAGVKTVIGSVRCTNIPRAHVLAESLTRSMVDAIIVNSVGIRDELVQRAKLSARHIHVVENGVDFQRFAPLPASEVALERVKHKMGGRRTVVVTGRICEQKNQLTLVRAIAAMKKNGTLPSDAHFILAGRDDHLSYGPLVRGLIAAHRLGRIVELVGIVPTIQRMVAAADGVLLASRYEGLPNAVIEAMACGKPVVVSPAANTDKLITDGVEGLICSDAGEDAIARTLQRFFKMTTDARKEMGERGLTHVRNRFTLQRMVEGTVAVYNQFLVA